MQNKTKDSMSMLGRIALAAILTAYVVSFQFIPEKNSISFFWSITNILVIGISVAQIARDDMSFSLNKMTWYFTLLFMGIAPMVQRMSGYYPWNFFIPESIYIQANIALLLWCCAYSIFYEFRNKNSREIKNQSKSDLSGFSIYLLVLISLIAAGIKIAFVGFDSLFIRGEANIEIGINGLGSLIEAFNHMIDGAPAICCGLAILKRKKGQYTPLYFILLLFAITLCLNWPISSSRFWAGTIYLGLIACLLSGGKSNSRIFDITVIVVLCILFPLFTYFKYYSFDEFISGGFIQSFSSVSAYLGSDFDAYSFLCRSMMYVTQFDYTYGVQSSSAILFFIPRAIWSWKGYSTGELVSSAQGSSYTNVSMPIYGEAFIDFGWLGIIFFSIILAVLIRKLDDLYWLAQPDEAIKPIQLAYPFLLGLTIFVYRGALIYALAYGTGMFLLFFIFIIVSRMKNKKYVPRANSLNPMPGVGFNGRSIDELR